SSTSAASGVRSPGAGTLSLNFETRSVTAVPLSRRNACLSQPTDAPGDWIQPAHTCVRALDGRRVVRRRLTPHRVRLPLVGRSVRTPRTTPACPAGRLDQSHVEE